MLLLAVIMRMFRSIYIFAASFRLGFIADILQHGNDIDWHALETHDIQRHSRFTEHNVSSFLYPDSSHIPDKDYQFQFQHL